MKDKNILEALEIQEVNSPSSRRSEELLIISYFNTIIVGLYNLKALCPTPQ